MEKLELQHLLQNLAPYLPYGLKGNLENLDYYDTVINKELYRIETGKTEENKSLDITVIVGDFEGGIEDFKPILHPLSDLTKEIEVNGEMFIPIERLIDIQSGCNWSTSDYLITEKGNNEYWTRIENGWTFGYNSENQFFYLIDKSSNYQKLKNQLELFQKLYEWHFDIHGLIEKGLAININTLKNE